MSQMHDSPALHSGFKLKSKYVYCVPEDIVHSHTTDLFQTGVTTVTKWDVFFPASPPQCPDWPELMDEPWDVRIIHRSLRHYKQSMELSGTSPSGGAFPGVQDGGSMALGAGSTFSESSIFSAHPSQLMWNLVTRGLEARMFLWSWEKRTWRKAL